MIVLILLCTSCNVKAQSISSNLLQNKLWKYKEREMVTEAYTATKSIVYFNGVAHMEEPYYLSDTIVFDGNFDTSKVGMSVIGKYIVTPKGCYEVISITEKNLVIRNVKHTYNVNLFID